MKIINVIKFFSLCSHHLKEEIGICFLNILVLGSLVLFSMRLIHAEALRFTSNPWATLERIDKLEKNVNKVTYRLHFFPNFFIFAMKLVVLES